MPPSLFMTNTLLDFSRRDDPELRLLAEVATSVVATAAARGVDVMIVGATARDLHMKYRFGREAGRKTEDVDLAFAIADWDTFLALRDLLIASGMFSETASSALHALRHCSGLPVDMVPCGGVETPQRQLVWPPDGTCVMNTLGLREALASAHTVLLPGNVETRLVSLPAFALLKIVAWQDRYLSQPRKDAYDLMLLAGNYLDLDNQDRLHRDHADWLQYEDFDYELAGARLLGRDIGRLLAPADLQTVSGILGGQVADDKPSRLADEMQRDDPAKALALLRELNRGLLESAQ